MLGVGSRVKLAYDMDGATGTIISMNFVGKATVRFTEPFTHVVNVDMDMLREVDDNKPSRTEMKGNPTIDNAPDNGMSIEQQIEYGGIDGWIDINHPFTVTPSSKASISDITITVEDIDDDTARLTIPWKKALHQAFVDMAIDTGDFEWLAELANQYK